MTDQEKKETGHRLLGAFEKMFNTVAMTFIVAEGKMSDEMKKEVARTIAGGLVADLVGRYPNGQLARHDLKAIGEQFGIKFELVELDISKAGKAGMN